MKKAHSFFGFLIIGFSIRCTILFKIIIMTRLSCVIDLDLMTTFSFLIPVDKMLVDHNYLESNYCEFSG